MKELQIKRLKESLNEKWLPNLEKLKLAKINEVYKIYNHLSYRDTCACCEEWFANGCFGCPIFEHTGEECCVKTPYKEMIDDGDYLLYKGDIIQFVELVQEECDFLSMLIDKLEK